MGLQQRMRGWFRYAGLYWLPPLIWMAVMFVLSTDLFANKHTGGVLWRVFNALALPVTHEPYTLLHFLTRKAAHLTEYAILAGLLLRAFRAGAVGTWRWHWALISFLLVAVHAVFDEYHQALTRYRTSSVSDSVLDMTGGLIALTLLWLNQRKPAGPDHHKKECSMRIFG